MDCSFKEIGESKLKAIILFEIRHYLAKYLQFICNRFAGNFLNGRLSFYSLRNELFFGICLFFPKNQMICHCKAPFVALAQLYPMRQIGVRYLLPSFNTLGISPLNWIALLVSLKKRASFRLAIVQKPFLGRIELKSLRVRSVCLWKKMMPFHWFVLLSRQREVT